MRFRTVFIFLHVWSWMKVIKRNFNTLWDSHRDVVICSNADFTRYSPRAGILSHNSVNLGAGNSVMTSLVLERRNQCSFKWNCTWLHLRSVAFTTSISAKHSLEKFSLPSLNYSFHWVPHTCALIKIFHPSLSYIKFFALLFSPHLLLPE